RLMNIQSLDGGTCLPAVVEAGSKERRSDAMDIGIWQHDRGIVATELQREPLEIPGAGGHHFSARLGRPSENHLVDIRMGSNGGADLSCAVDEVEHACREQISDDFHKTTDGDWCI